MNRYAKDRSRGPQVPPVRHIELEGGSIRRRIIALVLFIAIAAGALTYGISSLVRAESGWQKITADSAGELNLSTDFTLLYEIGTPAREERLAVSSLYSQACVKAWQLFNCDEQTEGTTGLIDIAISPNTELYIDPALYSALQTLRSSGSRYPYYAPLFGTVENLCTAPDDNSAAECDPDRDNDTSEFFSEVLRFAGDTQSIELRLLGENCVCLFVSEEYLAYAAEQGITRFFDLFALRNAFAADYIADCLEAAGYTKGILQSNDGYVRILNSGSVSLPVYDMVGNTVYTAGTADISGMRSAVTLKCFTLSENEACRYYRYSDGTLRTPWLTTHGYTQGGVPALIALSGRSGCAELALTALKAFMGSDTELEALAGAGIRTIYCRDYCVYSDVPGIVMKDLYDRDGIGYIAALTEKN